MKILCIYHSRDLDGWMSGAIVQKWFTDNYSLGTIYTTPVLDHSTILMKTDTSSLTFFGWDYGIEKLLISQLLVYYDKIIMCDVCWDSFEMIELQNEYKSNFIWIDHHKSAIEKVSKAIENSDVVFKGIQDTSLAACELTWKYFFAKDDIPEIVELLGKYDSFRHMGTKEESKIRIFQFGARTSISNVSECYDYLQSSFHFDTVNELMNLGKIVYKYLKKEAKLVRKNEFALALDGKRFLCVNQPGFNPKNFEIDFHKEGYDGYTIFYFDSKIDKWRFTIYSEKIDVSKIAVKFGGGGHAGAAGFEMDTYYLKKYLNKHGC